MLTHRLAARCPGSHFRGLIHRQRMRLADFILRDMESILVQWEAFAATQLPAAASMKSLALRDHAKQILEAVAKDLSTSQSRQAQTTKSLGQEPKLMGAVETAAETHALLPARTGFKNKQFAAEYRALRASVLRLWTDAYVPDVSHVDDMIRFNEAIDQAIAESIDFFSAQVEQARNLLLGMLGHDMRSPLQTIQMTASYLAALNAGADVSQAAVRLINSGARMHALLDDLIDFNRSKLGLGITITPADVDLGRLFADEVSQLRAAHPQSEVELNVTGNASGVWDGLRLQQILGNLVGNAIKYGAPNTPVQVTMSGTESELCFQVRNKGSAIEGSILEQIFDPLKRGPAQENSTNPDGGLGLGLYIAREIAQAHGGHIEASSDPAETVFTVSLPRHR
jgi:signal transduction histidine kinase